MGRGHPQACSRAKEALVEQACSQIRLTPARKLQRQEMGQWRVINSKMPMQR